VAGNALVELARNLQNRLVMTGKIGLFAVLLVLASGCATVAPYERGTLAHPSMTPDDMSTGFDEHVRAVSEGATGGFGGGGGGCGCN
jgi:hypothetical protein